MAVVAFDGRLADLVDLSAEAEKIASGFVFTEGPVWHSRERSLIFSDIFDAHGGTMYRWTEGEGAVVLRRPSHHANGNTYDRQGRLVTCEHDRRVSRTNADGSVEPIASHYQDGRLNSPNDIICAANGDLIFTDPTFGLRQPDGTSLPQEVAYAGVYRLSTRDASLTLLVDDFEAPNGLVISDDQSRLFIDDSRRRHVRVFDVAADGSLGNGRVFAEVKHGETLGGPDGMKLDSRGNLYVAANTPEGIWVFSPEGTLLGFIGVGESPANLAWGGDDWRTMFVTARTSVYRVAMKVAGQPVRIE